MANEKMKKSELNMLNLDKKSSRKGLKIILIIVIVIAAIYIAGIVYFHNRFCINGSVFGISIANETMDSLRTKIKEKVDEYTLTVNTRDGEFVIEAEEIGLNFDDKNQIQQMKDNQNVLLWPAVFFPGSGSEDVSIDIVYDKEMFEQVIMGQSFFDEEKVQAPVDAYLEYEDGAYEVIPEDNGNLLKQDETMKLLSEAVYNGENDVNLDEAGCYETPQIYSDNESLAAQRDELNKWLAVEITYDFGDRSETVTADMIHEWLVQGEDFSADLDRDKVREYISSLALKYDTYGCTREFKTSKGKTVTLTGGDYGWCMLKDKTTDALIEQIKTGESAVLEPSYLYSAKSRNEDDIGGTYVEISIQDQTMWCYKDGKLLVETPVVTGNPSKGNETPAGSVWAIDGKKSPATLGTIETMGYSSDVTFWMPYNGNVGIHDADGWRTEYGGDIYKTNGSHGCVNTPYDAAEKIYNAVEIGTAVVVY